MGNSSGILQTSVSGKDGITGTGFIFSCETTKNTDKICEAMVLKTLECGSKKIVSMKRCQKREIIHTIAPTSWRKFLG